MTFADVAHTMCFLAVSAGVLKEAIVTKAPEKCSDIYIYSFTKYCVKLTNKAGYLETRYRTVIYRSVRPFISHAGLIVFVCCAVLRLGTIVSLTMAE